jgi:glycosyltransferase involved in cell wall biosynthesis
MVHQKFLVLISGAVQTCGVEAFTRLLARHLGGDAETRVLDSDVGGLRNALAGRDALVFNFPIVGWKQKLFAPAIAALVARIMGKNVLTVLHEWSGLDWKRRIVLAPVVLLSSRVFFSAPEIDAEFKTSPLDRFATRRRDVLPIPPNVMPSEGVVSAISTALGQDRAGGRMIIAQFGSIYPQKQTQAVLATLAALVERGHDAKAIFVGSFIKGQDNVEAEFFDMAAKLGVRDRVQVTGYIETDAEIAGIFGQVDAFCYRFTEGLTSRRGSVMAAALSGRPVVVNAPAMAGTLDHHPLIQRLIETGRICLVGTDAGPEAMADRLLEVAQTPLVPFEPEVEIAGVWDKIVAMVRSAQPNR